MTNAPAETNGYIFNQTMMRIKDPAASLEFYRQVLGMTQNTGPDKDQLTKGPTQM